MFKYLRMQKLQQQKIDLMVASFRKRGLNLVLSFYFNPLNDLNYFKKSLLHKLFFK